MKSISNLSFNLHLNSYKESHKENSQLQKNGKKRIFEKGFVRPLTPFAAATIFLVQEKGGSLRRGIDHQKLNQ
jgi:hypothetical protein